MKTKDTIKVGFILFVMLVAVSPQRVPGCILYEAAPDKSIRCAECLQIYGLTSKFTCELCKTGELLSQGKCVDITDIAPKPEEQKTAENNLNAPAAQKIPVSPNQGIDQQKQKSQSTDQPSIPSNLNDFSPDSKSFQSFGNPQTSQSQIINEFTFSKAVEKETALVLEEDKGKRQEQQFRLEDHCLQRQSGRCTLCEFGFSSGANGKCEEIKRDAKKNCFVYSSVKRQCLRCEQKFQLSSTYCLSAEEKEKEEKQKKIYEKLKKEFLSSNQNQTQSSLPSTKKTQESKVEVFDSKNEQFATLGSIQDVEFQNNEFSSSGDFASTPSLPTTFKPTLPVSFEPPLPSKNLRTAPSPPTVPSTPIVPSSPTAPSAPINQSKTSSINSSNSSVSQTPSATLSVGTSEVKQKPVVHKYPEYPFCGDFFDGQCWACIPGYVLNLIVNQCVKTEVKTTSVLIENERQIRLKNIPQSFTPDEFCNIFDQKQGLCSECFRDHFLDKKAKKCTKVSQLCRTFNPQNGLCTSCYQKYNLRTGICEIS